MKPVPGSMGQFELLLLSDSMALPARGNSIVLLRAVPRCSF